jgi:hypothetical protein
MLKSAMDYFTVPSVAQPLVAYRVCVKVENLRHLGYTDLRDWLNTPGNVYCGRNGRVYFGSGATKELFHYPKSKWCNPFKVNATQSLDQVLEAYYHHLWQLVQDPVNYQEFMGLYGQCLGCWCESGKRCHVDTIIGFLEYFAVQQQQQT